MDIDFKKLNNKIKPSANDRLKKIFLWVLGGHIFVLFSPLAISYLGVIFKPKEKKIDTIKITRKVNTKPIPIPNSIKPLIHVSLIKYLLL
jgi:hypothetical protein